MPDEAKLAVLRQVGFRIVAGCVVCRHGCFSSPASAWGTCAVHRYQHLRQDNPEEGRGVSIHRAGTCPTCDPDPERVRLLGAHAGFLDGSLVEEESS